MAGLGSRKSLCKSLRPESVVSAGAPLGASTAYALFILLLGLTHPLAFPSCRLTHNFEPSRNGQHLQGGA